MRSYEGIHFVQWVFKELSTETVFPQTTATSTPDTPNLLSWYFFFSSLLLSTLFLPSATPQRENPPSTSSLQDWGYFLFFIHVDTLSRLELKLCGASTFSSTRREERREGVTATKGRGEGLCPAADMNNSLQVNLPRSWAASSGSLQEKSEHSFFLFYYYRMEDEAVLDRGASFLKHVCDEEEVEGEPSGSGKACVCIRVSVGHSYGSRTFYFGKLNAKSCLWSFPNLYILLQYRT